MKHKDLTEALTALNLRAGELQRDTLRLSLRLQSEGIEPDASEGVADRDAPTAVQPGTGSSDGMAELIGEIDHVRTELLSHTPSAEEALTKAKDIFRNQAERRGQSHLVGLIDKVTLDDLKGRLPASGTVVHGIQDRSTAAPSEPVEPGPTPIYDAKSLESTGLEGLIGPGSIFLKELDSMTITGGCGRVGLKTPAFSQHWDNDVLTIVQSRLKKWPSGFYRDEKTKARQLMIKTEHFAIVLEGLPANNATPQVLWFGREGGFQPVNAYPVQDRQRVFNLTSIALRQLAVES
ncbi:hypothetical protein [Paraburkholderia sp. BCC1886]|uniref:hypothetical protein n=1 Tax=Paraburkholderia sp. BCC1886 TaxID=2562670 RepID=UPI0011840394|nr:hypothetical protein [Paraburkholderia sp. BCC1886]